MTEPKHPLHPLLERIRSKSVLSGLFAGLLMSSGLSAQHSAGHTVTIRIIRPIQFSVENAANEIKNDARPEKDGLRLTWKSDSKPKRVTISNVSGYSEEALDLPAPAGNSPIPDSRMRLAAAEGRPADAKDRVFYTVMDI
jgi:hypothetical protein